MSQCRLPPKSFAQSEIDEEIQRLETHPPHRLTRYKTFRTLVNLISPDVIDGPKERQATIQALKILRNSQCPICRLPDEILGEILIAAKAQSCSDPRRPWLRLTIVCHRWREVILSTPAFWADILVTTPHSTKTMIERSKCAPLHLHFNLHSIPPHCVEKFHVLAASASEKIQGLHVRFGPYHVQEVMHQFLCLMSTCPVPQLQKLVLEQVSLQNPIKLPKGVIWDHMPSLRYLQLTGTWISPDLPNLPSLRHLEIDFRGYACRNLSVLRFLGLLRGTPNLDTLRVDMVSSENNYTPAPNQSMVSLPCLQELSITFQDLGDAKLFRFLDFPISCRVFARYRAGYPPNGLADILHLVDARSQLPIQRGALTFLGKMIELELYLPNDRRAFFKLEFPHRFTSTYQEQLLSLSMFVHDPEMKVSFVACDPEVFRRFVVALDPNLNITLLTLNGIDCSVQSLNEDTLLSVVKARRTDLNPGIQELCLHKCSISKTALEELRRYTRVLLTTSVTASLASC